MSSSSPQPAFNNWVKCSEGLIECGRAAAKIIKQVVEPWHQKLKSDEYKCKGEPQCKPLLKNGTPNKPNAGRGYCPPCIKWTDEDVIPKLLAKQCIKGEPPYEIHWHLVKSAEFYDHAIQVMKLFGLKRIKKHHLAAIKKFDDFDPAWLLSIMEKVKLFHKGNIQSQVRRIRPILY